MQVIERAGRSRTGRRIDGLGEVVQLVRAGGARTVSELAGSTGLARSTVGLRVEHLLRRGVLQAGGDVPAQRGRPPTVLRFNPRAGVVLVAQLGMTGARIGVVDLAGEVLLDASVAVAVEAGAATVIDWIAKEFDRLLRRQKRPRSDLWGIGIGLPGAVDLTASGGSGWAPDPVADRLRAHFGPGVPTFIDHDLRLLSLGEQRACWPDIDVLLCVKVGTVIGCGVVIGGQAVRGAQGLAGEIGHAVVTGRRTPCRCGNVGCLNAVAGGGALAENLAAQGLPAAHASDVADLARAGVPEAVRAVRAAGRDIGRVLATTVNLLNPSAVALWGYLVEAEEPLFAGIRETVYRHSLPAATRNLQLVRARMGDNAGVQGAAIMVLDEVLAPEAIDRFLQPA
ncbi:MAG TPA: ROK family protein [Mycobacteriales bacterium]|nr:ROK family protein [Mycobacteriales bacterium]